MGLGFGLGLGVMVRVRVRVRVKVRVRARSLVIRGVRGQRIIEVGVLHMCKHPFHCLGGYRL